MLKSSLWMGLVFAMVSLSAFASFGLVLAMLWWFGITLPGYKLGTALLAASLALALAGALTVWFTRRNDLRISALFGGFLGVIAFTYLLGFTPLTLVFILLSSVAAAAGGLAYLRLFNQRIKPA